LRARSGVDNSHLACRALFNPETPCPHRSTSTSTFPRPTAISPPSRSRPWRPATAVP
jgi:hypothetical protein